MSCNLTCRWRWKQVSGIKMVLSVPRVCNMVFQNTCNTCTLKKEVIESSDIIKNWATIYPSIPLSVYLSNCLSVHPATSDVLRFDSMYLSQSSANSNSFHFSSMQCNLIQSSACIQPQLPIEPTFYTTLSRHSGPNVTSHAFPDASWALSQAPAKDGWSTDQTSPTDLCNTKANQHSCWKTSVLDSVGKLKGHIQCLLMPSVVLRAIESNAKMKCGWKFVVCRQHASADNKICAYPHILR